MLRAVERPSSGLVYRSRFGAWIGKGATCRSWWKLGEVQIDRDQLVLAGADGVIASCPVANVSVHPVRIWFGMGALLDMGDAGRWYVQPQYRRRPKTARRATKAMTEAIASVRLG